MKLPAPSPTPPPDVCRVATTFLDADHPSVLLCARSLTLGTSDACGAASALFRFVRDQVSFIACEDLFDTSRFVASNVLAQGRGICIQKAVLLTALARAAGIPARLAFADIRNHRMAPELKALLRSDVAGWHGFVELLLEGQWRRATPAFDEGQSARMGIALAIFDGSADATLPLLGLNGAPAFDYLRFHGSFADLPHTAIIDDYRRRYG